RRAWREWRPSGSRAASCTARRTWPTTRTRRRSVCSSTTSIRSPGASASLVTPSCSTTRPRTSAAPRRRSANTPTRCSRSWVSATASPRSASPAPSPDPHASPPHWGGGASGYDDPSIDAPLLGVSHVQLQVSDVATSADWYTTVLGLERFSAADDGSYVALQHRPSHVVVVLSRRARPWAGDAPGEPLDHLAFAVSDG